MRACFCASVVLSATVWCACARPFSYLHVRSNDHLRHFCFHLIFYTHFILYLSRGVLNFNQLLRS